MKECNIEKVTEVLKQFMSVQIKINDVQHRLNIIERERRRNNAPNK